MMTTTEKKLTAPRGLPLWLSGLLPLVALALMLAVFAFGNPLAMFRANLPPIENLTFDQIKVTETGFEAQLINGGPDPVTIAQVMVDDAYWQFTITPSATIPRLGRAVMTIPYPWVEAEPNVLRIVTTTGVTTTGGDHVAQRKADGKRECAADNGKCGRIQPDTEPHRHDEDDDIDEETGGRLDLLDSRSAIGKLGA